MSLIASSIPGRLRLRNHALRDPTRLAALRAGIMRWRNVAAVEANPKAGSLLIRYDARMLTRECCEARALAIVEKSLGKAHASKVGAGETVPQSRHRDGTSRVRANRWAKRGMLSSLAVSLLLAAAGTKRWHALTGVLFLHALAAHLWVHRRHILR